MGGDRGLGLILKSPSLGRGKTFLGALSFCFSDLQLEPQHLSLGFYYSCYTQFCTMPHSRDQAEGVGNIREALSIAW